MKKMMSALSFYKKLKSNMYSYVKAQGFGIILRLVGALSLTFLFLSPTNYHLSCRWFPYLFELFPYWIVWFFIMLFYFSICYLEYYLKRINFFYRLNRVLFSILFGGFYFLGIKMVVVALLYQDIIIDKGWLTVVKIYPIEQRLRLGNRWAEEYSTLYTKSSFKLSEEDIDFLARNTETIVEFRKKLQSETVQQYIDWCVEQGLRSMDSGMNFSLSIVGCFCILFLVREFFL